MKLPKQQGRVLETIVDYVREHGYAPSIEELNQILGTTSTSTMHYHLQALEKKGYISRIKGKQRAIQVNKDLLPDAPEPNKGLPILGRIAAGMPLLAIEDRSEYLNLAIEFYQPDNYVLIVQGDSMIEDNIADGDMVIVQPTSVAREGETVVALVDNNDTTLKRFYREGLRHVRLQPANSSMEPIIVPREKVQIQGKVVAVVRRM